MFKYSKCYIQRDKCSLMEIDNNSYGCFFFGGGGGGHVPSRFTLSSALDLLLGTLWEPEWGSKNFYDYSSCNESVVSEENLHPVVDFSQCGLVD